MQEVDNIYCCGYCVTATSVVCHTKLVVLSVSNIHWLFLKNAFAELYKHCIPSLNDWSGITGIKKITLWGNLEVVIIRLANRREATTTPIITLLLLLLLLLNCYSYYYNTAPISKTTGLIILLLPLLHYFLAHIIIILLVLRLSHIVIQLSSLISYY